MADMIVELANLIKEKDKELERIKEKLDSNNKKIVEKLYCEFIDEIVPNDASVEKFCVVIRSRFVEKSSQILDLTKERDGLRADMKRVDTWLIDIRAVIEKAEKSQRKFNGKCWICGDHKTAEIKLERLGTELIPCPECNNKILADLKKIAGDA